VTHSCNTSAPGQRLPAAGASVFPAAASAHWEQLIVFGLALIMTLAAAWGLVILTTPEEYETWLTAPAEVALKLQQLLPDDRLEIVADGLRSISTRHLEGQTSSKATFQEVY